MITITITDQLCDGVALAIAGVCMYLCVTAIVRLMRE